MKPLALDHSAFVSGEWLEQRLGDPQLVVVDIRNHEEYREGHIPGAVSSFFGSWIVERDGLMLELPSDDDLRSLIGSLGIGPDSAVVVAAMADSDYSRADATRVAWTMIVAGLRDAVVLDGGYGKWIREGRAVAHEPVTPRAVRYGGRITRSVVVSKAYVADRIGKATILDARDSEVYFGVATEPYAPRAGHIRSAVNLPTPWAYKKDGTLVDEDDLETMARNVIGSDKTREVIVYCGVGGYASTWWFILTRMLGYTNVRFYDGSAQEWTADQEAPMTAFSWQ